MVNARVLSDDGVQVILIREKPSVQYPRNLIIGLAEEGIDYHVVTGKIEDNKK